MYDTTSFDTASFKILITSFEREHEAPEISIVEKPLQLSDFFLEAGLYKRKASLADRILAIAELVPSEEWDNIPADLAERYRDYKRNVGA